MTTPTPWWLNAGRRRFRGAASDPGDRPLGVCVLFLTAPDAVEDRVQRRSARVNLRQSTQKARSTSEGDRVGAQCRPTANPANAEVRRGPTLADADEISLTPQGVTGWIPVSPTQNPCNCWPSCSGSLLTPWGCKVRKRALYLERWASSSGLSRACRGAKLEAKVISIRPTCASGDGSVCENQVRLPPYWLVRTSRTSDVARRGVRGVVWAASAGCPIRSIIWG